MFREEHYLRWLCQVGGGFDDARDGGLHGHGVFISPRHVVTAHHVFSETTSRNYDWLMVRGNAGHYKAELLEEFVEFDLVVIEIRDRLDNAYGELAGGPILFQEKPSLGLSVGVLSHCEGLLNRDTLFQQTCFSQHSVMMKYPLHVSRFVLTSGLIQKSMSGSPVYTFQYELVGLVVDFMDLELDMEDPSRGTLRFPVMSPIFSIRDELLAITGT